MCANIKLFQWSCWDISSLITVRLKKKKNTKLWQVFRWLVCSFSFSSSSFFLVLDSSFLCSVDDSLLRQLVLKESQAWANLSAWATVCQLWQRAAAQGQSRCGFALLHMSILGQVDVDLFMFGFFLVCTICCGTHGGTTQNCFCCLFSQMLMCRQWRAFVCYGFLSYVDRGLGYMNVCSGFFIVWQFIFLENQQVV